MGIKALFILVMFTLMLPSDLLAETYDVDDDGNARRVSGPNGEPKEAGGKSTSDIDDATDRVSNRKSGRIFDRILRRGTKNKRSKDTDAEARERYQSKIKPAKAADKDSAEKKWTQKLDAFESKLKNSQYKKKRQTMYFDGSFSFKKKKFSEVTVRYDSDNVNFDDIASEVIGKGGALLNAEPGSSGEGASIAFAVPNEMVSFFAADEMAKRGASSVEAKVSKDGKIPLRFKFDQPVKEVGTDKDGILEIRLSVKEYRKLYPMLFKKGAAQCKFLKTLVRKRYYGRLRFWKRWTMPNVTPMSVYEELPAERRRLYKTLMLPRKIRAAWLSRSPEALAENRAKLRHRYETKELKDQKTQTKRYIGRRFNALKKKLNGRYNNAVAIAKEQRRLDSLRGELGFFERRSKFNEARRKARSFRNASIAKLKVAKKKEKISVGKIFANLRSKAKVDTAKKARDGNRRGVPHRQGKHSKKQKAKRSKRVGR